MVYPHGMADDSSPRGTSAAWHSLLAEHDRALRTAEEADEVAHAVEVLEQRLAKADAMIHTLEQGVVLRDQILHEQQALVHEQQARLDEQQARLDAVTGHRGLPRGVVRLGRGLRRRAARLTRRAA